MWWIISRTVDILLLHALLLAGCTDMYDGPRIKPLEGSRFFSDSIASRPLVEGTVPRDPLDLDEQLVTGRVNGKPAVTFPFPITEDVLRRGHEKFNTFCSPCHGRTGEGEGMIVLRGFPKPNSFLSDSVRVKPVGHFFDVITNGFGRMYSYAPSIPVTDRWAIVAYIRVLQFSRQVNVSDLSADEKAKLQ